MADKGLRSRDCGLGLFTKGRITIRIDRDVLDFFRSGGSGWQTRVNKVLRDYMNNKGDKGNNDNKGNRGKGRE